MISLLIFDVDGVLTDGHISPGADGDTQKVFSSQDGFAMKYWRKQGRKIAMISGRKSLLVDRRAAELGVDYLHTGVETKMDSFHAVLAKARTTSSNVAYVGDDVPDLSVMNECGVPIAVANARPDVKRAALYVSRRRGGDGAAAEIIEWLLRLDGAWGGIRSFT